MNKGREQDITCAKIAQVQTEGKRQVTRTIPYFNLDMIISVGYRVNSKRGTKFRQWASKILKEYMMRGYSVNRRFEQLERRVSKTEEQIDFFVARHHCRRTQREVEIAVIAHLRLVS